MSPRSGRRRPLLVAIPLLAATMVVGGCAAPAPVATFDPAGPCASDGRQPGAYPQLEALLPVAYQRVAPGSVDSGRSCTEASLGRLYERGVRELRYAGATWDLGGSRGVTYAVFEGAGVDPAAMIEFYEAGARATGRADALEVRDVTVAGQPARRLDTIHRQVGQTIIAWPGAAPNQVRVILTSALGEADLATVLGELAG